jgi:DNA-directed RNA polymerase II subunit RPB2
MISSPPSPTPFSPSSSSRPHWHWKILESYYESHTLADLQIRSYDELITRILPDIIADKRICIPLNRFHTIVLTFEGAYIGRPYVYDSHRQPRKITPNDARLRDLSYETSVSSDVSYVVIDNVSKAVVSSHSFPRTHLFMLPVMLRSSICHLSDTLELNNEDPNDCGGYFIVKGKERVLIAQERINYNSVYVYGHSNSKYSFIAEIRSIKEDADYSVLLQAKLCEGTDRVVFSIPYVNGDVPMGVLFGALGILDRAHELVRFAPDIVSRNIDSFRGMSVSECLRLISKQAVNKVESSKEEDYMRELLQSELLPHMGFICSEENKFLALGSIVTKLLKTNAGLRPEDDRDHITNKRAELCGDLIGNLIRALFKRSLKSVRQFIEKKDDSTTELNIIGVLSRFNITQRLTYCFTTGNWGVPKSNYIRQGVSQVLSRLSYIGYVSHIRKLIVPIGKESRNTKVRQLHSSTFGFLCPVETPEGQACGTIKNFSLLTRTSFGCPDVCVADVIERVCGDFFLGDSLGGEFFSIYLNGILKWVVGVSNVSTFVRTVKHMRETRILPFSVSVAVYPNDEEIKISSDTGRILRPVIQANKFPLVSEYCERYSVDELWGRLIRDRIVVYIDGAEAETSFIHMFPPKDSGDYVEIHPSLMLGISASMTPFPDHSQGPRNIYASAMSKQAIGMYALSYQQRFDTIAHVLDYPQRRLTTTKIAQFSRADEMPSGINCIVAIACYGGFNQEDSILMNKSAIDRGLFMSSSYRTLSVSETKTGTHDLYRIEPIPEPFRKRSLLYNDLDSRGIILEGSIIQTNSVLVSRLHYINDEPDSDVSLFARPNELGRVVQVIVTTNSAGYMLVKVKIQKIRIPEVGDKCASIHAQKGTIGMVYRQEDMPFTADGIVPDIILNPHAIPSRMTINMLMEMLTSKAGCFSRGTQDASAFSHDGDELIQRMGDELHRYGYERLGMETLYNGFTGKPLKARIFMGPVYYHRLKHLVADKMHARSTGNVQILSRQPCAGRSRDGGLRFGEMERDCMLTHGVSSFLKERLFDMSDKYDLQVCSKCGSMVNHHNECWDCQSDTTVAVALPYACKLLFQELQAMCIQIKLSI